jgi:hypothetical protein
VPSGTLVVLELAERPQFVEHGHVAEQPSAAV